MLIDDHTPLQFLLDAYFHQDFEDVTGDPESTVAAFLTHSPEAASALADEAEQLVASDLSDSELEQWAEDAGNEYAADWDGGTYRDWFTSIAAQARAYAAEHPQP